jgi:hypothetical protein
MTSFSSSHNRKIIFYSSSNLNLDIEVDSLSLKLTEKNQKITEVLLTIKVNNKLYNLIEDNGLFNLKPEVKNSHNDCNFTSSSNIIIEAILNPDLLPILLEKSTSSEEAREYLINLSHQRSQRLNTNNLSEKLNNDLDSANFSNQQRESLLDTQNWFCLSVKQIQDNQEVGFKTFWSYVNFSNLEKQENWEEQISKEILNFVNDLTENSLTEITEKATNELERNIEDFFEGLNTQLFEEFTQYKDKDLGMENDSILEEIIDFFEQEEWNFVKIQDKSALRLSFQGENGQWDCLALANEESREFVFYSLFPLMIPENKRMAIAELITRINYGISLGNFELDFVKGKVNYKTSLNVKNDYLTDDLIQNLVYTNLSMMDKYLPILVRVIDENLSPLEALINY